MVSVPQNQGKDCFGLVGSRKRKAAKQNITRLEPGSKKKGRLKIEYINLFIQVIVFPQFFIK